MCVYMYADDNLKLQVLKQSKREVWYANSSEVFCVYHYVHVSLYINILIYMYIIGNMYR